MASATFSRASRGVERQAPSAAEGPGPARLDSADCSCYVPEVVETLRIAIAGAGRLPRSADLLLCGLCAEYLVAELHNAGLSIVRIHPFDAGASGTR
jgi:hypothetical protein